MPSQESKPMKSAAIPEDKSNENRSQVDTKPKRERIHTFRNQMPEDENRYWIRWPSKS